MTTFSFFLNGQPTRVSGRAALGMLAPFLRREKGLVGTKTACSEGACGSCSVLLGKPNGATFHYDSVNACLLPVWNCDGCHVVTVEGLNGPDLVSGQDTGKLSPVQNALVQCHGTQCGFCTPGIAVTLTAFHENGAEICRENVQSALEGNLCRCTGYSPIIEAGMSVDRANLRTLEQIYPAQPMREVLDEKTSANVEIYVAPDEIEAAQRLFVPRSLAAALRWKTRYPGAIVVAGATEVGVAMNLKGFAPPEILSLARVEGLDEVSIENGVLILGARATWAQVAENPKVRENVPELATLLARWASPQLRNVGTVAGNIVRASPISDSLPFLLVCEAEIELESLAGARRVAIAEFLEGGPNLRPDELLKHVFVPLPSPETTLRLFKVAKRRAFDRSIASAAFLLKKRGETIESIAIAFGGVAPQALRLKQTEDFLREKPLCAATWRQASQIAQDEISPLSDSAASAEYRRQLVTNLLRKFGGEVGIS